LEYAPAEDTFALLDSLPNNVSTALEIGCGSCFILAHLDAKYKVGCDIRKPAIVSSGINFVLCDGRKLPFRQNSFQLAFFNPPYLPSKGIQDPAVDGGRGGVEIALLFLTQSLDVTKDGGQIFTLLSSFSDLSLFRKTLIELRLNFSEKRKRLFFEELDVFKIYARKNSG
jgi:methylase of polypeptide subunit release factors